MHVYVHLLLFGILLRLLELYSVYYVYGIVIVSYYNRVLFKDVLGKAEKGCSQSPKHYTVFGLCELMLPPITWVN